MSVFSKLLDKLGRRKQGPTIVGTLKVASPDPLSTASIPASKAAADENSLPPAMPSGTPPVSAMDFKKAKRMTGKRADD